MSNASSRISPEGAVSAMGGDPNISLTSSPMSPPPMAKSPLSAFQGMQGDMNHAQPNSPNAGGGYIPVDMDVPSSAHSSPEDPKEPLDSSKGRLIENEKVLEYGGPNNRYGKVSSEFALTIG